MKKVLAVLSLAIGITMGSCSGGGPREESDDKDSIDAVRAADSLIQNELNSDTSMNTSGTTDNLSTDSMPKSGEQP